MHGLDLVFEASDFRDEFMLGNHTERSIDRLGETGDKPLGFCEIEERSMKKVLESERKVRTSAQFRRL
ncbi:MAG: hypothetical protein ACREDA_11405 [Methylocella sp.]